MVLVTRESAVTCRAQDRAWDSMVKAGEAQTTKLDDCQKFNARLLDGQARLVTEHERENEIHISEKLELRNQIIWWRRVTVTTTIIAVVASVYAYQKSKD